MTIMNARRQLIILLAIGLMTGCSGKGGDTTGSTGSSSPYPSWSPPPAPDPAKVDGPGDTAILVLDHFKAIEPDKRQISKPSPGKRLPDCTYVGTATNEVGSGGGGSGLPPGVSHGQAVYETVLDDLRARALTAAPAPPLTHPLIVTSHVDALRYKDKTMLLAGVEIQEYDTALLAAELKGVMDAIKQQTKITRFVLNMSFVVAPCDIKAWFEAAGNPLNPQQLLDAYRAVIEGVDSLNDLKTVLASFNPGMGVDQLLNAPALARAKDAALVTLFQQRLIEEMKTDKWPPESPAYQQVTQEPLRAGIHNILQPNGYQVIPVGASGNGIYLPGTSPPQRFRPDFPFAPALWNVVVSAGAGKDSIRADYSNGAEVMLDPANRYKAKGTSFAAPHLSAMEALYLMGGGQVVCDAHIPPLGYTNVDAATKPMWDNLWLSVDPRAGDPALAKCKVFKQNIPVPAP